VKVSGTGTISGITGSAAVGYNTSSKSFSFIEETSANHAAALLCGTVVLHENSLLTGNTVTLKADNAASADYDYAFCPNRPSAANVIMVANLTSSEVTNVWKAILGTTDQVTVTQNASDITFSLPQSIHTGASPAFTGLTLSGLTASQVVVSNGSKALASLAYAKTNTTDTLVQRDGTSINANLVGNVTGNCSGSSGSCTGNAATSSSCTGNAATSSSCTGNAATSSSCSGNSATATTATNLSGGTCAATTLSASGYTTLGSGGPAIAMKKLSLTTTTVGGVATVAHSLSLSRIIAVFGSVTTTGGTIKLAIANSNLESSAFYNVGWDGTNVRVITGNLGSSGMTATVYVMYEAS
jgi:hypothetical protein